jgi:tetratricopeptide (TPR) repeat protein
MEPPPTTDTAGPAPSPAEWAERAEHLRAIGRLADAEQAARTALADDPQDGALLGTLSAVLLSAERFTEGLAAADAAVAADPEDERAHRLRTLHLIGLGRPVEAVHAGHVCVTMLPDEPAPATCYARALQAAGRLGDAMAVAHRVVALAPDTAGAHLLLADVASDLSDRRSLATARAAYEQALRLDPQNALAQHDLAVLDARSHRPARALRGLIDAGRMDPGEPAILRTVAAVMWQLSWRLRIWLIVATVGTLAASGTATGARIAGGTVLVSAALLGWWTARDLPRRALPVVRAAVRTDRPLTVTYLALAYCLLVYVLIVVTGSGWLGATVWVVVVGLGWLALLIRLVRRRRR